MGEHSQVTSYSRQDVLRILQISSRQLLAWEKAGLVSQQQTYTFQDLGQLRTLRSLRAEDISAASIRDSILAMKAVAGMSNPLQEACPISTGTGRLAFRHRGAIVDPIRRQFLFDFDRSEISDTAPSPMRPVGPRDAFGVGERFFAAVQAEEMGEKQKAIHLYEEILKEDPNYAPAYINLGTIYFHLRQHGRAEELYRSAIHASPDYVLAYFDLGNVLDEMQKPDESTVAYEQAVALSPGYADAHYNLALAYERKGQRRRALRHWQAYVKLDKNGPWAEHARSQLRKLLGREKLAIISRGESSLRLKRGEAKLELL